jgi:hypothetical protein
MNHEALSTIMVLPSNEGEIKRFVETIKSEILGAGDDPLKVLKQLKMVEKTIAILLKDKDLDNFFIDEAIKYGNSFEHLDTHFDVREVGTKYDYSSCNDSVWNYLNDMAEKAENKLKERETFLKTIPLEGVANPETGELIYRPAKTSTSKVCVKL